MLRASSVLLVSCYFVCIRWIESVSRGIGWTMVVRKREDVKVGKEGTLACSKQIGRAHV